MVKYPPTMRPNVGTGMGGPPPSMNMDMNMGMAKPGGGRGVDGPQRMAIAHIEAAVEMLDAAAAEAPQLQGAISNIKRAIGMELQRALSGGAERPLVNNTPVQIPPSNNAPI